MRGVGSEAGDHRGQLVVSLTVLSFLGWWATNDTAAQPFPNSLQEKPKEVHIKFLAAEQAASERQRFLDNELKMPGFGLEATAKQLAVRLSYALEHQWAELDDLKALDGELKVLNRELDKTRDSTDADSAKAKRGLSSKFYTLNERFEELVMRPLISVQGKLLKNTAPPPAEVQQSVPEKKE